MADKLLLCISKNEATAARWRNGRLTDCRVFENSEAGVADFKTFAAASGNLPAFVIVDAIEEDYRVETLPHASGSDRAQMVDRKLRQFYRGSPYSAASLVGRDSGKRRDDRFLFSALTNADLVAPWLSALTECGLPVGGIYLLPMVMAGLVEAMGEKANNLLLVSVQPVGIRLTFFRTNAFRLSRLSGSDAAADAKTRDREVVEEISNTRLYLHALRAATLDEPVSVALLDHRDQLEGTARAITHDNPNLQCTHLGRAKIAALLKFDPELLDVSPSIIYLQLLGLQIPANNLAPATVTAGYQRYQRRRSLFAASAVVVAIGIAWSGYNLWEQITFDGLAGDAAIKITRVNAEYQAATARFPNAPTSAENLRSATELAAKLRSAVVTPERFMRVVGATLDAVPEIALTEIAWQYRSEEYKADGSPAVSAPQGVTATAAAPGSQRKQSGLLSGQIRDFKGDFRGAVASINALVEKLAKDPMVESVRIVRLPLNASSTIALSGNTAENSAQAGTAEFKLLLVLRPPA